MVKPLIPLPRKMQESPGHVRIVKYPDSLFEIIADDHSHPVFQTAREKLTTALCGKTSSRSQCAGGYPIFLSIRPDEMVPQVADAYKLNITEEKAEIIGYDAGGALYGVVTLLQLLVCMNGENWHLPLVEIEDWPEFEDRGYFFETRWGSEFLTKKDYFEIIDYCANLKINQLTIGIYGCWNLQYDYRIAEYLYVPLHTHPELQTPSPITYYSAKKGGYVNRKNVLPTMFVEDFFGEVCAYAKTRNIKIKPLFNSLGHNTLIPRMHPDVSAKNTDGSPRNFGFCLTDEKTYDLMFSIYDEIIDKYLTPNGLDGFQIGLDEVRDEHAVDVDHPFEIKSPRCDCHVCKEHTYSKLFTQYIIRLTQHLKSKGMKHVYVYHDMLMNELDVLHDDFKQELIKAGIDDVLVIDYWSYRANKNDLFRGQADRVTNQFRGIMKPWNGYYHWMIPMASLVNIRLMAEIAKKKGFEGIESYAAFEYCYDQNQAYQAELSWNADELESMESFLGRYAARVSWNRQEEARKALDLLYPIMAGGGSVFDTNYYFYCYCRVGLPYPQNYPSTLFQKLIVTENGSRLNNLRKVAKEAGEAAAFFAFDLQGAPNDRIKLAWALTAKHYAVHADELATLLLLHNAFNAGTISEKGLLTSIGRLKEQRHDLIAFAECARMEATQYTYIRNMSLCYQLLADLERYLEDCINKNVRAKFDLTDLSHVTCKEFDLLR